MSTRSDGRRARELRTIRFERHYTMHAPGSVLISCGDTKVLCTAMFEGKVPPFLVGSGQGWATAEYGMLPSSTTTRKTRERQKVDGRSQEIQRLIGRALRGVLDLKALREHTIWVDCDVLQADGGTRTASITGAYVALVDAVHCMMREGRIDTNPIRHAVAAVSVGVVDGRVVLDLPYQEDSRAEVDMNVVMTSGGDFIEVQGTAEARPFPPPVLQEMLDVAAGGIMQLIHLQEEALAS